MGVRQRLQAARAACEESQLRWWYWPPFVSGLIVGLGFLPWIVAWWIWRHAEKPVSRRRRGWAGEMDKKER